MARTCTGQPHCSLLVRLIVVVQRRAQRYSPLRTRALCIGMDWLACGSVSMWFDRMSNRVLDFGVLHTQIIHFPSNSILFITFCGCVQRVFFSMRFGLFFRSLVCCLSDLIVLASVPYEACVFAMAIGLNRCRLFWCSMMILVNALPEC